MKVKEVKDWLKNNIKEISKEFCLEDWKIQYKVSKKSKDNESILAITYDCLFKYKHTKMEFYADLHKNPEHLEETLRHELYHVLLSPMAGFVDDYKEDHDMTDDAYTHACAMEELTVWNLEQHFKRVKNG